MISKCEFTHLFIVFKFWFMVPKTLKGVGSCSKFPLTFTFKWICTTCVSSSLSGLKEHLLLETSCWFCRGLVFLWRIRIFLLLHDLLYTFLIPFNETFESIPISRSPCHIYPLQSRSQCLHSPSGSHSYLFNTRKKVWNHCQNSTPQISSSRSKNKMTIGPIIHVISDKLNS